MRAVASTRNAAAASGGPDLAVESDSVSSPSAPVGQSVSFRVNVTHRGFATAAATKLRFFRSSDPTIGKGDSQLAKIGLPALPTNRVYVSEQTVSVGPVPGRMWLGACVDTVSGDGTAANDCSTGIPVDVGVSPELDWRVELEGSQVPPGVPVTENVTLTNVGAGGAPGMLVELYESPAVPDSWSWAAVPFAEVARCHRGILAYVVPDPGSVVRDDRLVSCLRVRRTPARSPPARARLGSDLNHRAGLREGRGSRDRTDT